MSDKITYILEVLDKYSVNTKKFKSEMLGVQRAAEGLNKTLMKGVQFNSALPKTIRDTDNLTRSLDRMGRVQQKNYMTAMQFKRSIGGAYTPIRFNPEAGKYEGVSRPQAQPVGRGGGGMGVSFGGVAKAMGYYSLIDKAVGLPREIFNTRREFDNLGATLEAVMPKYDRTVSAQAAAEREMEYLKKTSYDLGLNLNAAKEEYVKFLAASAGKSSLSEVHKTFEAFSKLSTVYQITPYRFGLVMNALTQMTSKSVVSMEELKRQLGDSLPGALSLFGKAAMKARPDLVKTEGDFIKLVEAGRVSSKIMLEVAKVITTDTDLMGGLDKALGSLNSRTNRLSTSWANLLDNFSKGAIGEGLGKGITALDKSLQSFNTTLNQTSGAFKIIGDTTFGKILFGMLGGLGTVLTEGTWELAKAPFVLGEAAGGLATGRVMGDNEGRKEVQRGLRDYYFGSGEGITSNPNTLSAPQQEQKLVIEFIGNVPSNMSVPRSPPGVSVRNSGTLTPAGGSY